MKPYKWLDRLGAVMLHRRTEWFFRMWTNCYLLSAPILITNAYSSGEDFNACFILVVFLALTMLKMHDLDILQPIGGDKQRKLYNIPHSYWIVTKEENPLALFGAVVQKPRSASLGTAILYGCAEVHHTANVETLISRLAQSTPNDIAKYITTFNEQ